MNFADIKTIAVVGLSDDPSKASNHVASYLQNCGYRVIPINPGYDYLLGEKAYPNLASVPSDINIDVVDIFRRPDAVKPIVEQAVDRGGVKVIWMQEGVVNEEASDLACKAGLECVMNKCMLKEHIRTRFGD